jgi:uncharacterized protein with HEPN domain
MSEKTTKLYVRDMLSYARDVVNFAAGIDEPAFEANRENSLQSYEPSRS